MTLGQLLVLHLMAGAGVAVAVYLTAARGRGFQALTAVVFWPLYLPLLLAGPRAGGERTAAPAGDELARAIARADAELDAALRSLDGWAERVLAREKERLHELRVAWTAQAERVRAMDRLLQPADAEDGPTGHGSERLRSSRAALLQNRDRLRQIRERTHQDLLETLAWVRELASMIHLAKFTGAPAARAEELVAQIAAAVEGLSAVTWQDAAWADSADGPRFPGERPA